MIDLSFLSEEEQETVLSVLKRDAELKKTEEQRIQNLQKTVSDKSQLRYLTGEWFYETKQLRHLDRIHGSDIIRASMRHTHKPLTLLELSQILPEKSSFVSSENKDVFVPPVLCGLLEEPHVQLNIGGDQNLNDYTSLQDSAKPGLQSPTKRINPFNSELPFKEKDNELLDGTVNQSQTPNENISERCHLELLSPAVSHFVSAEWKSGKPVHLETVSEEDCPSQSISTDWSAGHSICFVDATSDTNPSYNGSSMSSSLAVSPKPKQRLTRIFRRQLDKQKEELHISKQKEPSITQSLSKTAANVPMDKPASVKQETKPPEMVEVRTLQLTALQNTPFRETLSSVDASTQLEATKGRTTPFSVRLFNQKGFWEREHTDPKITFARDGARQNNIAKTEVIASQYPQSNSCEKNINDNLSHQMEMTVNQSEGKNLSPQTVDSVLVNLSRDDGTYRANPVFIDEETSASLTGSVTELQVSEPEENNISPVLPTVALDAQKLKQDIAVLLPRQSSSTHQEGLLAKISETEHLRKKEYARPKKIPGVKEVSTSSVIIHKSVSPQCDLRTSLDNEEMSGIETKISSYKTKSKVLKSLKVTDKGFVSQSPDRSQLRSADSMTDVLSPCHKYQVKVDTESQERPVSPSKSQTPVSKDKDETIRRSPSKTCHPKVLPRESSNAKGSWLEDSPLKTFSIDISSQTKATEEQQGKLILVPRQRRSPSHTAKQTLSKDINLSTDIIYPPLPSHQSSSNSSTSPHSKKASEKNSSTFTHLTRSFIPQDHQHYLGPNEKAHIPHFNQRGESEAVYRQEDANRDLVGNQSRNPTEESPPGISSWAMQNKDGNSCQGAAGRAWSLSRASSGSHSESSSPIMSALKRLSSRNMTSSKSLEKLSSETKEGRAHGNSREQINLSVDDVYSLSPSDSTLANPMIKNSLSVPVLQQNETDSDGALDTNLGFTRKASSSMSNMSISSGLASMSSVSGSLSTIYPSDFGDIEVQGSIQFAVNYIQNLGEFHIFVVLCRDLAVADNKKNCSDPYVKCYLLPDKTKLGKRKTSVKKKMLNPTYNEILRFKILMEVLKTQNLNISVWHNNTFGRNSFLGEVDLDLSEWDFRNTQINDYTLKARVSAQTSASSPSRPNDNRSQMRVALRFLPQTTHRKTTSMMKTGEVQIWVKDCKNLPPVRGVVIDPFVKCTVLPDTSRKSRQKTRVVKRTANPMFNHTMVYDGFRPEDLREACVEITVWDYDRLHNHYIGGLRLGLGTGKSYGVEVAWMDSTPNEANLWQRMLLSDGEWVEDDLPLRMLVMAKTVSK